ncbi:hypothetical protein HK104_006525, partial [Borealophlyctis nickersoniae]
MRILTIGMHSSQLDPDGFSLPNHDGSSAESANTFGGRTKSDEYFEKRRLAPPWAKAYHLWGLLLGMVIGGEYFIWNEALRYGFGSLAAATAIVTVLYWNLTNCLAELTAALPFSGGTATFATAAFGSAAGMFTGMAYTIEFILDAACYIVGASKNLNQAFNFPVDHTPTLILWWTLLVLLLLAINSWGVKPTFILLLAISLISVAVLIAFAFVMIPHVDFERWVLRQDVPLFADGVRGVFLSLPFCVWWYIGLEIAPCSAEETSNTRESTPVAMFASTGTINSMVLLVMFINSAIAPGIAVLSKSSNPLQDGMINALGWDPTGPAARLMAFIAALPLFSGALAALYAASRHLYSLSRGGYLPDRASLTWRRTGAPVVAVFIVTACAGVLTALAHYIEVSPTKTMESALIESAVVFAYVGYTADMIVFIRLRYTMSSLPRPYMAPYGIASAVVVISISLVGLGTGVWTSMVYWATLIGLVLLILILSPYYFRIVRKRMVLTPEKAFIRRHLDYLFRDTVEDANSNQLRLHRAGWSSDAGSGRGSAKKVGSAGGAGVVNAKWAEKMGSGRGGSGVGTHSTGGPSTSTIIARGSGSTTGTYKSTNSTTFITGPSRNLNKFVAPPGSPTTSIL